MVSARLDGDVRLVRVELGSRGYSIHIGQGLIDRVGELLNDVIADTRRCAVVTSDEINGIHGDSLRKSLDGAGWSTDVVLVPDGEEAKTWGVAERLLGDMIDLGLDRRSVVIALGGGTVGDLSGFVSAIYLRGVRLVQVPTTLLAQVDSSMGGKTAVNHPRGKNLIGAFHQPSMVASDPELLDTLPQADFVSGLAEVVKYGVIADAELFGALESRAGELLGRDQMLLSEVIARCCVIKARFIELDERDEKGLRAALNYGHTVGHALEALSDYELRHGESVTVGMTSASKIAVELGLLQEADADRQGRLLERLGLDVRLPRIDVSTMVEAMRRDKKAEKGRLKFVLPTGIGRPPELRTVPDQLVLRTLEEVFLG